MASLYWCASFPIRIGAADISGDDLSDFSNDLATDLAPLLILFGEAMTKQYLSQSTRWLDYFIFAMCPIGILTTITSVIRVCGHSTLRAFIGRSQESAGTIEAELCTSTSLDVCELFNVNRVTRVLGRPNILELVYIAPSTKDKRSNIEGTRGNILVFRDFLESCPNSKYHWKQMPGSSTKACFPTQNPNLSLNVSIKKRPSWVYWSVAMLGLILQTCVLLLAGVGIWASNWEVSTRGTKSEIYAPTLFIAGTTLMCLGTWSCAALVGQTTHETTYYRQKDSISKLIWLQPHQVVGEQTFDPFAYIDSKPYLQQWISSTIRVDDSFQTLTTIAVLFTLVGYVAQFIGFRGMSAWISLAQLGCTVIMSICRGLLRIQHLKDNDNEISEEDEMKLVPGYELDWLAFTLSRKERKKRHSQDNEYLSLTDVTGQVGVQPEVASKLASKSHCPTSVSPQPVNSSHHGSLLLDLREQLADLTGYENTNDGSVNYPPWPDRRVKVRPKAKQVHVAVSEAMASLLDQNKVQKGNIIPKVHLLHSNSPDLVGFKVPLDGPRKGAGVEATLGLWVWSLIYHKRVGVVHDSPSTRLLDQARVVQTSLAHNVRDTSESLNVDEMELWMGLSFIKPERMTCEILSGCCYGRISLWKRTVNDTWYPSSSQQVTKGSPPRVLFGRDLISRPPKPHTSHGISQERQIGEAISQTTPTIQLDVEYIQTNHSLLEICAQELFFVLITSISPHFAIPTTSVSAESGKIQLKNEVLTNLAKLFNDAGLGSIPTGLMGGYSILKDRLPPPSSDSMREALKVLASNFPQNFQWDKAFNYLNWTYVQNAKPHAKRQFPDFSDACFLEIGKICESLRLQVKNESSMETRRDGIHWMVNQWIGNKTKSNFENILPAEDQHPSVIDTTHLGPTELATAIGAGDRKRTFLMAAASGHTELVRLLLDEGLASFRQKNGQTPLSEAVKNGHVEVVRILLGNPKVSPLKGESSQMLKSLVQLAMDNGQGPVLELLLGIYKEPLSKHMDTNQRVKALQVSAETRQEDTVELLLKAGTPINNGPPYFRNLSALQAAARSGLESVFDSVHKAGASVGEPAFNINGRTVLQAAAESGNTKIVQKLIGMGANVNAPPARQGGRTTVQAAAEGDHMEILNMLIREGAELNAPAAQFNGRTALQAAVESGHVSMVERLLDMGAGVNDLPAESGGRTALQAAVETNNLSLVELLLKKGAKVHQEAALDDGCTALSVARRKKYYAIVELLESWD